MTNTMRNTWHRQTRILRQAKEMGHGVLDNRFFQNVMGETARMVYNRRYTYDRPRRRTNRYIHSS